MKYIHFTYVDAETKISIATEPARTGPAHPDVVGLQFVFARESEYPKTIPDYYGTCPDDSDINIDGVFGEITPAEFEQARVDEWNARIAQVEARTVGVEAGDYLDALNAQIAALRAQL